MRCRCSASACAAQQVNTLGVTWQLGRLDWSEVRADAALEAAVREIESQLGERLPDGYASEVNCALSILGSAVLAAALREGVLLFIDYGLPRRQYYRSDRREGTLLCHYRHRFHDDPLHQRRRPGHRRLGRFHGGRRAAVDCRHGQSTGFTTQAHFLIGNGIERLLASHAKDELTKRVQLARQAMLLTLPGEMGERFKVIGLSRGFDRTAAGFAIRDPWPRSEAASL